MVDAITAVLRTVPGTNIHQLQNGLVHSCKRGFFVVVTEPRRNPTGVANIDSYLLVPTINNTYHSLS